MKILLATLNVAGHEAPASVLSKILQNAGHNLVWKRFLPRELSSTSLAGWFERFTNLIPTELVVLRALLAKVDLLITDSAIFAGTILHQESGIPWIQFGNVPLVYLDPEIPCAMQASVSILEPFYRRSNRVHFVGPLVPTPNSSYQRPSWWNTMLATDKKVIHVSQGTIDSDYSKLLSPAAKVFSPNSNFYLVSQFVPHKLLMPNVDVFITNGGFGGISAAVAAGVPMIVAGENEEKALNAEKVEKAGLGINLKTERPSPRMLLEATLEVLENPRYRRRARMIARIAKPKISRICHLVKQAVRIQGGLGDQTKEASTLSEIPSPMDEESSLTVSSNSPVLA